MKHRTLLIFFLFVFFIYSAIYCQNTHEINFRITDSEVVLKQYPNATKINAEIIVQDLPDTLFLYYFNKCVSPSYFISDWRSDFYKEKTIGLSCVIVDNNNHIISQTLTHAQLKKRKDVQTMIMSRIFVSSKLIFVSKRLNMKEKFVYDLAKYKINSERQSLELFPLLIGNHYVLNLLKGEYYLYFIYSFHETRDSNSYPSYFLDNNKPDESKIYRGYFMSNKVKLIVE